MKSECQQTDSEVYVGPSGSTSRKRSSLRPALKTSSRHDRSRRWLTQPRPITAPTTDSQESFLSGARKPPSWRAVRTNGAHGKTGGGASTRHSRRAVMWSTAFVGTPQPRQRGGRLERLSGDAPSWRPSHAGAPTSRAARQARWCSGQRDALGSVTRRGREAPGKHRPARKTLGKHRRSTPCYHVARQ